MNKEELRKRFEQRLFADRSLSYRPSTKPPAVETILSASELGAVILAVVRWNIFYSGKIPPTWDSYWAPEIDIRKTHGRFNLSQTLIDALICHPNPHAAEATIRHQVLDKQQLALALNRQYTADYWTIKELEKNQSRKSSKEFVTEAFLLGYRYMSAFQNGELPSEYTERFVKPLGVEEIGPTRRRVFLFAKEEKGYGNI